MDLELINVKTMKEINRLQVF